MARPGFGQSHCRAANSVASGLPVRGVTFGKLRVLNRYQTMRWSSPEHRARGVYGNLPKTAKSVPRVEP
jgi:hypothetical protein